jgi:hypothetical protein
MESTNEIVLEIQNEIYNENIKLVPFLNDECKSYFTNLELDYKNEEINSIYGMDNIYDSKYEKIKVYSDFNFHDASNVLLYMLVTQLNNFILCKNNSANNNENNDFEEFNITESLNSAKCYHISNFILLLFNEIDADYNIYDEIKECSQNIRNNMIHDKIEYKSKLYEKDDEDYFSRMMSQKLKKKQIGEEELGEIDEISELENNEDEMYQEKIDFIMKKGKAELAEKLGYNPTDDQLESYKNDYLQSFQDAIEIEDEIYDLGGGPKGKDVLDQGEGYGGFTDYDFETGDGFDYSE